MSRKPSNAMVIDPSHDAPISEQVIRDVDTMSQLAGTYAADRDLVNQLLGQAQMADASAEFFLTVRTSKLTIVKENKLYRHLAGRKSPDGQDFLKGTWEEFCRLIGRGVAQADEDIKNYRELGAETLESLQRAGIGYRELRTLRRLPDEQKEALATIAKSEDKEEIIGFAEEIIANQAREKAALRKELDDAKADIAAKEKVAENKERTIERLHKDVSRAKRTWDQAAPEERLELLRADADKQAMAVRSAINAFGNDISSMRSRVAALMTYGAEHNIDQTVFLAGLFAEIERDLLSLRDEYGIPDTVVGDEGVAARRDMGLDT